MNKPMPCPICGAEVEKERIPYSMICKSLRCKDTNHTPLLLREWNLRAKQAERMHKKRFKK